MRLTENKTFRGPEDADTQSRLLWPAQRQDPVGPKSADAPLEPHSESSLCSPGFNRTISQVWASRDQASEPGPLYQIKKLSALHLCASASLHPNLNLNLDLDCCTSNLSHSFVRNIRQRNS